MRLARVSSTAHSTDTHQPADERSEFFARGRQPANEGGEARTAPRPREPPSGAGARQRVAGGGNRGVPSERRRGDRSRKDGEGDDRERRHRRSGAGGTSAAQGEKRKRTLRKAKREEQPRATGEAGGARHDARERARHGAKRRGNRS